MTGSLRLWPPLVALASVAILAACSEHSMQQSQAAPMTPAPAVVGQTPAGNVMTTPTGIKLPRLAGWIARSRE